MDLQENDELRVYVIDTESTTYETWQQIKKILLNNKGSHVTT